MSKRKVVQVAMPQEDSDKIIKEAKELGVSASPYVLMILRGLVPSPLTKER